MDVKRYNVSKPSKYTKDGVEKTKWDNIGTMTEFYKQDGSVSRILEIPAIGLNANIFPFEPKENGSKGTAPASAPVNAEVEIDPKDIPF